MKQVVPVVSKRHLFNNEEKQNEKPQLSKVKEEEKLVKANSNPIQPP